MQSWQLQNAKAHLSEVVKAAVSVGPQEITLRGEPAVVVISMQDYNKLVQPKQSFVEFMRASPLCKVKLSFKRDASLTRDVDL